MGDWLQNQANRILFVMVDSNDTEVSGIPDLSIEIGKNGGAFAAAAGTDAEVGNGWYTYLATAGEADTLGPVAVRVTGTGAVQQNLEYRVVQPVWSITPRTLTTPVNSTATVSSGTITVYRGDSWSIPIAGLGSLTGYTNIWFTVKNSTGDADTAALIQIDKTTGLLYSNAATAATAANGSITVDDASAGDITIALDEAESKNLSPSNSLYYDVQVLNGGNVTTLTTGVLNLTADVTRSIV